jgi:hypothetical protein
MSTHGGDETLPMNLKTKCHRTGKHKKPDLWKSEQTRGKKRKRTKDEKETFTSKKYTYPRAHMKVRVMMRLLFEAFNAWTCVETM